MPYDFARERYECRHDWDPKDDELRDFIADGKYEDAQRRAEEEDDDRTDDE